MIPRDGKYLGRATGSERSYSARRICAVTPVDARCVMARAGRGSGIGGVRLRSARVGESRHRLRTGVGADVGLKGEAAASVHRRIANINGESFGIGLAVESIRDGNRHGVRSLFGVFVIFGRQRSRTVRCESSMWRAVPPIDIHRPRASVRIAERAEVKQVCRTFDRHLAGGWTYRWRSALG